MSKIGRILASSIAAGVVVGTALTGLLVAPAQATETAAPNSDAGISADSDCTEKVKVGNSRYKGDIFHSFAKLDRGTRNHVGVYYTTKIVVEAPGPGSKSQARTAATLAKCGPVHKMYVRTTQANRDKAADYAYRKLRGKPFDTHSNKNKYNGDHELNSSELVWRAYMTVGIDLDRDGGTAVHADDIKNDGSTVIYSAIR
ncbi:hypothetical protein [Lentzea albidocapillata]|uniref:Peptidase inhibitor family I36 n=1 Tax=Lentzea albidocapillata TaxID=40571 RepID=A0A1W2FDF6_9PSEU|nr:hypothetical protein [Lentzea albidocapillata]SMD19950.1 hypothetical protein SAMN05660733_05750 [Lentzea albidocapillata]